MFQLPAAGILVTPLLAIAMLTEREKQVLQLLARGDANKQIAVSLSISENTVKTHLKSILAKLRVQNRTEAASVAIQRGIVRLPDK